METPRYQAESERKELNKKFDEMNNDFSAVMDKLSRATVPTDELAVKQKLAETGQRLDLPGNERLDFRKVYVTKSFPPCSFCSVVPCTGVVVD